MTRRYSFLLLAILAVNLQIGLTQKITSSTHALVLTNAEKRFNGTTQEYEFSFPDLWKPGQSIRIKFLNGTYAQQQKVKEISNTWTKYANIRFSWVEYGDSDVRIAFRWNLDNGSWSQIGKNALRVTQNAPTMNFGWLDDPSQYPGEWQRVVLHEFGHMLGLGHEHQSPARNLSFNEEEVLAHYRKMGWADKSIRQNVLDVLNTDFYSPYDPNSIMHYEVESYLTTNNKSVGSNISLSYLDQKFIRILYPFDTPTAVQKRYDNEYFSDACFPKDKISNAWEKGTDLTIIVPIPGYWVAVAGSNIDAKEQSWSSNSVFPKQAIGQYWNEGKRITHLIYGNCTWVVVVDKSTFNGQQAWATRSEFPSTYIEEYWKKGYQITNLTYGDGKWAVVVTKDSGLGQQKYFTRSYFPSKEIKSGYDEGYKITEAAYGNGVWAIVMNKNSGISSQQWRTRSSFPDSEISTLWNEGYYIGKLLHGADTYLLVMNK